MEYNTQRKKMELPEYGRSIQNMVDHALTIDDTKTNVTDDMGVTTVRGPKVQFKEILGIGFNYSF